MASTSLSETALSRLKVLVDHRDGFEIARKDLTYRGCGELIGMKQSGLGEMDLSEMIREPDLLFTAKEKADLLLDSDPQLADPSHYALKSFVESILTKPIDL
jgi:ATP-dependent DNA helicase RecG